jgi:hypothetical protein
MKVYSIYTDEMLPVKEVFLESIKDANWEINILYLGDAGEGGGDFASKGFAQLMKKKIEKIIQTIDDNMGDVIIWSDLDIQFFSACSDLIDIAINGKDIVLQAEHSPEKQEVNTGFCVIRCNEKTRALYDSIRNTDTASLPIGDQTAMNNLLKENKNSVKWGLLPGQFWAMSHAMVCGISPPMDIVFHHANCTFPTEVDGQRKGSIELKLQQLKDVKEYVQKMRTMA